MHDPIEKFVNRINDIVTLLYTFIYRRISKNLGCRLVAWWVCIEHKRLRRQLRSVNNWWYLSWEMKYADAWFWFLKKFGRYDRDPDCDGIIHIYELGPFYGQISRGDYYINFNARVLNKDVYRSIVKG